MLSKTIWNSVQITHWPRNRAAGSHLSMTETETETETPSAEITRHNTLLLWSMAKQFQCALSLEYNKWQLRVASSGFSIRFSSFEIVKQSTHTYTYTYTDTHTHTYKYTQTHTQAVVTVSRGTAAATFVSVPLEAIPLPRPSFHAPYMSRSVQVHQFQWHIHDVVPAPAAAAEATDATDEPAAAALEYLNMLLYLFFSLRATSAQFLSLAIAHGLQLRLIINC